jgi:hypothetical protein
MSLGFIEKAIKVHGGTYDYSITVYKQDICELKNIQLYM